jgi:general secretion pathway protein K
MRLRMGTFVWKVLPGNRGVALLVVLLITGLATVLAVALVSSQQVEIRRTANVLDSGQAFWLGRGVEDFAIQVLVQDKKDGKTDNLAEDWALGLFPTQVEGGVVSGNLEDMQGRLNLNNLAAKNVPFRDYTRKQLARLLQQCNMEGEVAQAVEDWIDEDIDPQFPAGAEDETYNRGEVAYRTANGYMASPSELLLVNGITLEAFRCLEPLVCTLPDASFVNINTAPAGVLAALAEEDLFGLAAAEELVEKRDEEGYDSVADFLKAAKLKTGDVSQEFLSVSSDYFLAHINVQVGNGTIYLKSLLHRKEMQVEVIRRTIGVQ